ncbi:MAG: phosphoheptose isomerase [Solirubrobacterales bacterium]|nr:phosphoheptose isomerase [Solirubrobacterales bacterium]
MSTDRDAVLARITSSLAVADLRVVGEDLSRPWGGFLVISQGDVRSFVNTYFADAGVEFGEETGGLSPKILLVAPGRRLSWQHHLRRSEIWRIVHGPVGISRGPGDEEPPPRKCPEGDLVRIALGERHRLTGLDDWGVVAEIWQHTDAASPSDEDDIVRLADDHNRT